MYFATVGITPESADQDTSHCTDGLVQWMQGEMFCDRHPQAVCANHCNEAVCNNVLSSLKSATIRS